MSKNECPGIHSDRKRLELLDKKTEIEHDLKETNKKMYYLSKRISMYSTLEKEALKENNKEDLKIARQKIEEASNELLIEGDKRVKLLKDLDHVKYQIEGIEYWYREKEKKK